MDDHLQEAIYLFREELNNSITSPAYRDLFITYDDTSKPLNKKRSKVFHKVVAKVLFIIERTRSDFEKTISYLTTRVTKRNERNWCKLKGMISMKGKRCEHEGSRFFFCLFTHTK